MSNEKAHIVAKNDLIFNKSPVCGRYGASQWHFQRRIRKIHLKYLQGSCGVERGVELLCGCPQGQVHGMMTGGTPRLVGSPLDLFQPHFPAQMERLR